jgi:hypothetical protein
MKTFVVTCDDGGRYDFIVEDDEHVELTDDGALKVTGPESGVLKELYSPAVAIHEMVLVAERPGPVAA